MLLKGKNNIGESVVECDKSNLVVLKESFCEEKNFKSFLERLNTTLTHNVRERYKILKEPLQLEGFILVSSRLILNSPSKRVGECSRTKEAWSDLGIIGIKERIVERRFKRKHLSRFWFNPRQYRLSQCTLTNQPLILIIVILF